MPKVMFEMPEFDDYLDREAKKYVCSKCGEVFKSKLFVVTGNHHKDPKTGLELNPYHGCK